MNYPERFKAIHRGEGRDSQEFVAAGPGAADRDRFSEGVWFVEDLIPETTPDGLTWVKIAVRDENPYWVNMRDVTSFEAAG